MKNKRRGFMLAEVVVVSVIISTVLVALFTGLSRMSIAYETRNRYYKIDTAYVAQGLNDIIVRNGYIDDLISDKKPIVLTTKYEEININIDTIIDPSISNQKINAYLLLANMNFYGSHLSQLATFLANRNPNSPDNPSFIEYLEYLSQHITSIEDYTYFIIVEFQKDIDDCYYYTLKVR